MAKQMVGSVTVRIDKYRRIDTERGGFTTVPGGHKEGIVQFYVDLGRLKYLAQKALRSKGGRSQLQGGGVVASVVDIIEDVTV